MKRLHVHVSVQDLAASVRFYSALFAARPTVAKPDYAKWMLDDPRVNFAISARGGAVGVQHLGIQAEDPEELAEVFGRLAAAGRPVLEEAGATCCYARSEKQWVADPQGVPWETFLTHGESTAYGNGGALGRLAEATDRGRARRRRRLLRAEGGPGAGGGVVTGRPHNAPFLRTGDSARGVIAEALPADLGGGRPKGHGAGSLPKGQVEATGRLRDDAASAERAS